LRGFHPPNAVCSPELPHPINAGDRAALLHEF
jgi:hypothetical protein